MTSDILRRRCLVDCFLFGLDLLLRTLYNFIWMNISINKFCLIFLSYFLGLEYVEQLLYENPHILNKLSLAIFSLKYICWFKINIEELLAVDNSIYRWLPNCHLGSLTSFYLNLSFLPQFLGITQENQ